MSKNLNQVPTAATSILATDKMYIARSPFGVTDDRYILGSDIIAQLGSPLTTKGDLFTFTTVDARLAVGPTNGQILQVNSGAATGLSWSTPAYPSASGAVGKIIISDGTNNVYSTPTYPNTAGTTGSVIISDGTNKINSTSLWPNTVGTALHFVRSDGTSNVYSTVAYPDASVTAGKFIISDGTNYIASTSIMPNTVGTAGTIIRSNGTINTYSTATFADTYLINTIPFAGSANTIAGATLTSIIDTVMGSAQGNILYRNASSWVVLAPGTAGDFLRTGGAAANVSWAPGASGTVTTFSAGDLSPLFTTSVANPTTAPALSFILSNAAANTYFGNATGGSAAPSYTSAGALSKVDDTNVTLTLGGAPTTSLLAATSLTLGWTGQLSLLRGGTNASLTASNGGIVWSNATQLQILSGTATAGQMLQSGSTASPSWSTATWPATTTANQLLYSSFNNTVAGLASAANSVLITSAGSVPSWSTTLPSGLTIPGYQASLTLPLSLSNGGTNANLTASNGGIFYSTASAGAILAGTATAGLCLLSGASTTPSWSTKPPVTQVNVQVFTSSGTYTPTSGMKYCIIEVVGSGGGGGGRASSVGSNAGGGGGAGSYSRHLATAADIGVSKGVTIGAGGNGGSAGANAGSAGSDCSLGTLAIGKGGAGGATGASGTQAAGGAGGVAGTGNIVTLVGSNGDGGAAMSITTVVIPSGGGGVGFFGGAPGSTQGTVNGAAGAANTGSGGAGGCAYSGSGNVSGGNGGTGVVIVTEYIST